MHLAISTGLVAGKISAPRRVGSLECQFTTCSWATIIHPLITTVFVLGGIADPLGFF